MARFKNIWRRCRRGGTVAPASAQTAGRAMGVRAVVARVCLVALALVACAVPAIFVNNIIGYLPLLVLVFSIAISFAYLQILARAFTFSEESMAPSCERGSVIDFVIHFKNASPLVFLRLEPYIYISDIFGNLDTITPITLTLMPHENKQFSFQASFDHIGTYSAGVRRVVIWDLLGLFCHTVENPARHTVEVMPRLYSAQTVPLTSNATSDSQRPRQALTVDDMDYAGVRAYVWGDPIKTIHWKLSSRNPNGEYLTRLFEAFTNPGVSIVIDTISPDAPTPEDLMFLFDGVVEVALSVNDYALGAGLDSVLVFLDKYGQESRMRLADWHDFAALTGVLPRITPVGALTNAQARTSEVAELLRREGGNTHGQDNVVVCTTRVDEEILTLLVAMKMRKRNPVLMLCVAPGMLDQDLREFVRPLRRLDAAQIPHFVLRSAADLGIEVQNSEEGAA